MSTQNKDKINIPKLGEANPGTPICSFMTPPENSQHCLPYGKQGEPKQIGNTD